MKNFDSFKSEMSMVAESYTDDSSQAHELILHADNTEHLHKTSHEPIMANLKKKMKKGTYDSEKAKKLWGYHADRAAQSYAKEHGDKHTPWHKMFPPPVRKLAAAHWEQHHRDELKEDWTPEDIELIEATTEEELDLLCEHPEQIDEVSSELLGRFIMKSAIKKKGNDSAVQKAVERKVAMHNGEVGDELRNKKPVMQRYHEKGKASFSKLPKHMQKYVKNRYGTNEEVEPIEETNYSTSCRGQTYHKSKGEWKVDKKNYCVKAKSIKHAINKSLAKIQREFPGHEEYEVHHMKVNEEVSEPVKITEVYNKVRAKSWYYYHPNLLDRADARTDLSPGDKVQVVNLHGAPKAGTMGHAHVNDESGKFRGLVHVNSLHKEKLKEETINEGDAADLLDYRNTYANHFTKAYQKYIKKNPHLQSRVKARHAAYNEVENVHGLAARKKVEDFHKAVHSGMQEETISELSKNTLASYIGRASSDIYKQSNKAAEKLFTMKLFTMKHDTGRKEHDKGMKRLRGVNTAANRLRRKKTDESVDINELSLRTKLRTYSRRTAKGYDAGEKGDDATSEKEYEKASKTRQGIIKKHGEKSRLLTTRAANKELFGTHVFRGSGIKEEILPREAHAILTKHNALNKDFHALPSDSVIGLGDEAKKQGYRKSASAPGSKIRMFHQHLSRLASKVK